uniref:Uncharacterized protein n=1 Tax=Siphoviridae sp. ctOCb13 TaxID=2825477 RepID=A0A8S5Q2C0_9CAUD|nr:MAG TPA: hypothetical protein [Siphoviridae sp. ctOCb13]
MVSTYFQAYITILRRRIDFKTFPIHYCIISKSYWCTPIYNSIWCIVILSKVKQCMP